MSLRLATSGGFGHAAAAAAAFTAAYRSSTASRVAVETSESIA